MTDEPKQKQDEVKETGDAAAVCPDCEVLREELSDRTAGWQRALADYQNLQKETEKRRGELADYAKQVILEEFIPVYEHLKLAINNESVSPAGGQLTKANEKSGWVEGVKHIVKQFADILKNNGVEEIKTVGEKFDPALHEAVGESPSTLLGASATPRESGIIIKEISGGYKMGEHIIRAAKVIVSK